MLRIPRNVDDGRAIQGLRGVSADLKKTLSHFDEMRWRTLPDDSGVVLEDRSTNRTIVRDDGTAYTFTFADLSQTAVNDNEGLRLLRQQSREKTRAEYGSPDEFGR
jgi:hypothetical protein